MQKKDFLIHEVLRTKFLTLLDEEEDLKSILHQILFKGAAYLIGGYVRDVFEGKQSRDLDIIVSISKDELKRIVESESCDKSYNRLGGVKLNFRQINVDIWSFDNNWAFKEKLVKLNENERLDSLAKGCFYNYDALVANVSNFTYCAKYYEDFLGKRMLNILQRRSVYKNLNPTLEANIIRAVYIKKQCEVDLADHLKEYIYKKMLHLNDIYGNAVDRLMKIKAAYPKYDSIDRDDFVNIFEELGESFSPSLFDFQIGKNSET